MNNEPSTDVTDYALYLAAKDKERRQLDRENALETIRNCSKNEEDFELLLNMLGYYND